jgi:hypothetical protein
MAILTIASGVALILFGVRFLRKCLDRLFGPRLGPWIQVLARNRLRAFFSGILTAILVPSSTTMSVFAVQTVQAGHLSSRQPPGPDVGRRPWPDCHGGPAGPAPGAGHHPVRPRRRRALPVHPHPALARHRPGDPGDRLHLHGHSDDPSGRRHPALARRRHPGRHGRPPCRARRPARSRHGHRPAVEHGHDRTGHRARRGSVGSNRDDWGGGGGHRSQRGHLHDHAHGRMGSGRIASPGPGQPDCQGLGGVCRARLAAHTERPTRGAGGNQSDQDRPRPTRG